MNLKGIKEMKEIYVNSSMDGTLQPSLLNTSTAEKPRPLLVGLHTWSFDRYNQVERLLPVAEELKWNLLLPEFRGPNLISNPHGRQACGSILAKQDIIDAVDYVKANYAIDTENILLVGGSGGGHMALLMAAYHPDLWKAVASYVPIADLAAWYNENSLYAPNIEYCCGGKPEGDSMPEYESRSPVHYIDDIAKANILIGHGRFDKSVPCTQSLKLYNELIKRHPDARVFLNIFDGGHELRVNDARDWLLSQVNKKADTSSGLTG